MWRNDATPISVALSEVSSHEMRQKLNASSAIVYMAVVVATKECARKYPIPQLNWVLGMNVKPNEFLDFLHSLIGSGQTSGNLFLS